MPLPETMGPENRVDPRRLKAMGHNLLTCIKQAHRRGHLYCGVKACAELLQKNAATVMLCILPQADDNVGCCIHQMLIKAYCHENFIPIWEVSSQPKMAAQVARMVADEGKGRKRESIKGDSADTTCLLLQCPKLGPTSQDETLLHFYNEMMDNPHPMPHLMLPD